MSARFQRLFMRLLLGRRLPKTSGTLALTDGPGAEVRVNRDRWGVPYIEADNEEDAWFALGFCQGQDRAFQLELLMRFVRGTVSALVGEKGLSIDRLSRRIGFSRAAETQVQASAPAVRRACEVFARGVTAGATQGLPRVPHEFALLQARPTAYRSSDAVAVLGLLSFALGSNWDAELIRLHTLSADGAEALQALDPIYPEWLPVSSPPGEVAGKGLDRLAEELESFLQWVGPAGGSNNWALSPSRTASGRPLLANDPHLSPRLPSQWYLAHVRTPAWTLGGATFVGAPGFAVGHNEVAAWGVTAGLVDNTDLFVEELGDDGCSVRVGDSFVPCPVREEAIEVKGAETIIEKVLLTPHGPLISPALEGASAAVSMRATWLDPHGIAGLFEAQTATDFERFRSAFSRWPVLPLNVVYADTKGAIGWQLAGQAPRRKKGVGLVPQHGRDEDAGWHEEGLPFADMPHLVDPACGFVASANNKPQREGEGPYLGDDWVDGYRYSRIVEVLGAHSDWSVERCQQLQSDTRAIPWFEMRDRVLEARGHDATADRGLDLLESWDGSVCPESNAASLYEFFVAEMVRRVVAARAPRSVEMLLGKVPNPFDPFTSFSIRRVGHLVRLLRERPAGWFAAGWKAEVAAALRAAWETLEAGWGKDPARWTWGALRPLRLEHPLGAQKRLGAIFNRGPYAVGGDTNTVHQAAVNLLEPSANALYAPTLRAVMDVGRWEESRFALSGGQSGNPFSPHYDDQLRLWLRGEGLAMAWSADEVAAATEKTLRLTSGG